MKLDSQSLRMYVSDVLYIVKEAAQSVRGRPISTTCGSLGRAPRRASKGHGKESIHVSAQPRWKTNTNVLQCDDEYLTGYSK